MKNILLLAVLFSFGITTAQYNPLFTRSDIICTKNFNALVKPYVAFNAISNINLLPQLASKRETLKSFMDHQVLVDRRPISQFKLDDMMAIKRHIDTAQNSVLIKTNKNVFLFKTNGNGNPDNILIWVTLIWKANIWELDAESYLTKPLELMPGDIIFRPTKM